MLFGRLTRGTSVSPMTIYIQRETFGEVWSKAALHFTVCGNEKISLVKHNKPYEKVYSIFEIIPNFYELDFRSWFKTDDINCPPYNFEILSPEGFKDHHEMF